MTKKRKILILNDTMPWGHRSIAKALREYLNKEAKKSNIEVEYLEVKTGVEWGNKFYVFIYRYFTLLGELNYILSNFRLGHVYLDWLGKKEKNRLKVIVDKKNPDIVVCPYFWYSFALDKDKERKYELVSIVADPWKAYWMNFIKSGKVVVYDEKMADIAVKNGVDKKNILVTGWWLREEAYTQYVKVENKRSVIFVGGGSLGNSSLPKFLWLLFFVKKPVKVIFNTGTDRFGLKMVLLAKKLLGFLKKDRIVEIEAYGWIDNLTSKLAECDIVFGKAGPNFLFECVAQEKPFVAITHIWGQEDANLDLIREKKLGWVKEKYGELKEFMDKYLENPEKYNNMYQKTIKEEAERNKNTHQKFTSIVAFPR